MKSPDKRISMIVAMDERHAIGKKGDLLCHLPNDLKHFKQKTTGHTILMGRKTYASLPKGALPNRTNMVITSDKADRYPGCIVVRTIEEAMKQVPDTEALFIAGGEQLYRATLPLADTLYITRIHHTFPDADTFFPVIDLNEWVLKEKEDHPADERHPYAYTFLTYRRACSY